MYRIALSAVMIAAAAVLADAASASTSLLGPGATNWTYACANGQAMNIVVRHVDRSTTEFSLLPGQSIHGFFVRQGDVEAWRCGDAVDPAANYLYIVTVP